MSRFLHNEEEEKKSKIHHDYQKNLFEAQEFMDKFYKNSNNTSLQIKLSKCTDNEHFYLVISYSYPMQYPKGNCANSISLNQSNNKFRDELEYLNADYRRLESEFCFNQEKKNG